MRTILGKALFCVVIVPIILAVGCAIAKKPTVTSVQISDVVSDPSCSFDYSKYSGKWQKVATSQAMELWIDSMSPWYAGRDLAVATSSAKRGSGGPEFDEAIAVIRTLYPDNLCFPPIDCEWDNCPSGCRGIRAYLLEHPDNPDMMFVAYNQMSAYRSQQGQVFLLRRIGDEWAELQLTSLALAPLHPDPRFTMIDWMAYVWECDGWSLYAGMYYTYYLAGEGAPDGYAFFQSRDNGESWLPITNKSYGYRLHLPISPPDNARLVRVYYHQDKELGQITRFAVGEDMTLYALTHSYSPTPTSTPAPSSSPAP